MESQGSVERPSSNTPIQDNPPSVGADQSSGSIEMTEGNNVHMSIPGLPVVASATGQALMQQLAAASDPAQTSAIANHLAQAGLMQTPGSVPFFPLNFEQLQQQQQGLIVSHAQQQFVPQSPAAAHQNSLASGESPAPHTPSSNSLGSPQPQPDAPGTPRSDTPSQSQAAQMDPQMQARLQQAQMMHALQAQAQSQVGSSLIFLNDLKQCLLGKLIMRYRT